MNEELQLLRLGASHHVLTGSLPDELRASAAVFEQLWAMHPEDFHEIVMHGRKVRTPRWQQAYGADYRYTGNTNRALPLTPLIEPWLAWSRRRVDPRLNGLLFNWYDGERGHYIGKHRDSNANRIEGSAIVTLSFGHERVFRFRPYQGQGIVDLPAVDGGVIVIPWETNLAWTHEVPAQKSARGRRISITLRAFHP